MDDLPEALRAHLERCYEQAEALGLDPEWFDGDDPRGFSFDCPTCRDAGRESHRCQFHMVETLVMNTPPPDTAFGPAG
jgi:hypothetical protein